jgi:hypothetical protein
MVANFNPPLPARVGWDLLVDGNSVFFDLTGNDHTAYSDAIELHSDWLPVGRHTVVMRTREGPTNSSIYAFATGSITITP